MNKIICGEVTLTDEYLIKGNCCLQHSRNGESLVYDTLDFEVWFDSDEYPPVTRHDNFLVGGEAFVTSDGLTFTVSRSEKLTFLTQFVSGAVATYSFDDGLMGKFYVQETKQIGKDRYSVSCATAVGILENSMHYGGMYSGTVISDILDEIFEGITYSIEPAISNLKMYGWLPYDTKRNNLQQITIATNIAVKIDSSGDVYITALASNKVSSITESRVVVGGSVSVMTPCTAVKVIEHTFIANDEVISLCESSFTTTQTIIFSEPAHTLSITNGTIVSSGANYATITGGGSVILTGKKYDHTQKEIVHGTVLDSAEDNIVTISDATLINTLNSSTAAKRLYDIYCSTKLISENISVGTEKAGQVVGILNPYTLTEEEAFMQKMDIDMGNILKAKSDFLVAFKPSGASSGYEHKVILSTDQTWTVPAGVTEVRAVLIGGGKGGHGGNTGTAGSQSESGIQITSEPSSTFGNYVVYENADGGEGGEGGLGGDGGKINDLGPIAVTPAGTLAVVIGEGGDGGDTDTEGTDGTATTLASYTSADGQVKTEGYTDIMTGDAYGLKGDSGTDGGHGIGGNFTPDTGVHGVVVYDYIIYGGNTYYCGWYGSHAWQGITTGGTTIWLYGAGGSGGGYALGAAGGNGTNGRATFNAGHGFAEGGDGGAGATATIDGTDATVYGNGGNGGNGGGGGGGGGVFNNPNGDSYDWPGSGGAGGAGSTGGAGKSGCVIIYY